MGFLSDFVGGAADTLMGKQEGENKESQKAAPRDRDHSLLWNDFLASLYGNEISRQPEGYLDKYIAANPNVLEELGIDPNKKKLSEQEKQQVGEYWNNKFGTPTYLDRLTQDTAYTQGNDQQLLSAILDTNSRVRENNQQYMGDLSNMVDSYRPLANSRFAVAGAGISGPAQFTSRSARDARDYVTSNLGTLNQIANATADLNRQGAAAVNQYQNAYTPNRVANEYQGYLQNPAMENERLRYGIPTTTSTGNFTPGLLSTLGTFMGAAGNLATP